MAKNTSSPTAWQDNALDQFSSLSLFDDTDDVTSSDVFGSDDDDVSGDVILPSNSELTRTSSGLASPQASKTGSPTSDNRLTGGSFDRNYRPQNGSGPISGTAVKSRIGDDSSYTNGGHYKSRIGEESGYRNNGLDKSRIGNYIGTKSVADKTLIGNGSGYSLERDKIRIGAVEKSPAEQSDKSKAGNFVMGFEGVKINNSRGGESQEKRPVASLLNVNSTAGSSLKIEQSCAVERRSRDKTEGELALKFTRNSNDAEQRNDQTDTDLGQSADSDSIRSTNSGFGQNTNTGLEQYTSSGLGQSTDSGFGQSAKGETGKSADSSSSSTSQKLEDLLADLSGDEGDDSLGDSFSFSHPGEECAQSAIPNDSTSVFHNSSTEEFDTGVFPPHNSSWNVTGKSTALAKTATDSNPQNSTPKLNDESVFTKSSTSPASLKTSSLTSSLKTPPTPTRTSPTTSAMMRPSTGQSTQASLWRRRSEADRHVVSVTAKERILRRIKSLSEQNRLEQEKLQSAHKELVAQLNEERRRDHFQLDLLRNEQGIGWGGGSYVGGGGGGLTGGGGRKEGGTGGKKKVVYPRATWQPAIKGDPFLHGSPRPS